MCKCFERDGGGGKGGTCGGNFGIFVYVLRGSFSSGIRGIRLSYLIRAITTPFILFLVIN